MSYAPTPTARRSPARSLAAVVLVVGAVVAAAAGVATGFVPLFLPALLLAASAALPPGTTRTALVTLSSIGLALVVAAAAFVGLLVLALSGARIG